jgi:hypothetical protein
MRGRGVEQTSKERRSQTRVFIEPYDTETFLEFTLAGKQYRFNLLDTSPGGMGMLVMDKEKEVLKKIHPGDRIKMKYGTHQVTVFMHFEIKHITPIRAGIYKDNYLVGLSLFADT